ncbi:MAG TPA: adenylate/guanylate cyclase domain-containing protein, partial [Geminicoccaceae bacterium]|nr:adenylate/guanylate cyclase domain-containing protein [Geminicoccaceae bacterium]
MAEQVERRLAAIMAADVVGYSRLMGADEAGTHARLRALRLDLIDPKIAEHRGRVVKRTGDGALVEFASAVDAVRCAVDIQQVMAARNRDMAEVQRIEFRVGINIGDIIVEDGDIFGDGVNVAARLEGLAQPGCVCISDVVHQMVRSRLDLLFEDLGEQRVKNIALPVRTWRWTNNDLATGSPASRAEQVAAPLLPDKPSLAVLPFDNLSADPEQTYFSDGMTEDLITDLSQISELFVTSRHASFRYKAQTVPPPQQVARDLGVRYVLEGSVRRAGGRVRINAQLIDARTGFHLWAQRYDRNFEDIFALQDEIVRAIVAALEVRLTARERAGVERRYTDNLEAYDLFLQAREGFWRRTQEGAAQARTALERAIALDPKFAAAHALLAEICRSEWWYGWRDDERALDRALELALKGVELDDQLPYAHMFLGWIHLWRKEHDRAIAAARRCLELDPNSAEGHVRLGHILDQAGRPAEGLPLIETAMRLDPHYPYLYLFWLGHVLHSLERYDEAAAAYRRVISRNPDFFYARLFLAAAYTQLGRMEEAKAEAAEAMRIDAGRWFQRF